MKAITNAMKRKAINTINEFRNEFPGQMVHGATFGHYGEAYRVEEIGDNEFKMLWCNPDGIYDTPMGTFSI